MPCVFLSRPSSVLPCSSRHAYPAQAFPLFDTKSTFVSLLLMMRLPLLATIYSIQEKSIWVCRPRKSGINQRLPSEASFIWLESSNLMDEIDPHQIIVTLLGVLVGVWYCMLVCILISFRGEVVFLFLKKIETQISRMPKSTKRESIFFGLTTSVTWKECIRMEIFQWIVWKITTQIDLLHICVCCFVLFNRLCAITSPGLPEQLLNSKQRSTVDVAHYAAWCLCCIVLTHEAVLVVSLRLNNLAPKPAFVQRIDGFHRWRLIVELHKDLD